MIVILGLLDLRLFYFKLDEQKPHPLGVGLRVVPCEGLTTPRQYNRGSIKDFSTLFLCIHKMQDAG
jgi:hypothetical protein